MTDDLTAEKTRLSNRSREQLWRYFPAMLELEQDVAAEWFLDLWELVPTPNKAARVREKTIAKLLKSHRIRRLDAAEVLMALKKPAVVVAAGTVEAATAHIRVLIERLRVVNRQLKDTHRQLDRLCGLLAEPMENEPGQMNEQRDAAILASLPGNGRIVLATLLAEGWEPLQRREYHALRSLRGAAPLTRRSGKRRIVTRRLACNPRLRNALYHWARVATQHDDRSRAKYAALRGRGHSHARALRSVCDRLLNVACAMLRDGTRSLIAKPKSHLLNGEESPLNDVRLTSIYHPVRWHMDGNSMAENVHQLRPKPGDSEKITINIGYVDLGHIDLMVQEGFYSNRTDFIRTAIRNQLDRHADVIKQSTVRKSLDLGLRHYSREDLEAAREAGAMVHIHVLGLASIAMDVTPELARATIASVAVLGALHASPTVKAALADRMR